MTAFFIFLGVLLVAGYLYKQNKKTEAPAVVVGKNFKFTGRVDAPSVEDKLKARDINLANGVGINTADPHGGIYLTGAFDFSTDVNGQVIVDTSAAIIHGSVGYTVHGEMYADGVEHQLTVKADRIHEVAYLKLTAKDGIITGRMYHGGGEWHVFGNVADGKYA